MEDNSDDIWDRKGLMSLCKAKNIGNERCQLAYNCTKAKIKKGQDPDIIQVWTQKCL